MRSIFSSIPSVLLSKASILLPSSLIIVASGDLRCPTLVAAPYVKSRTLNAYHGGLRELLNQLGEWYLANNQSPFGILSGHLWIPPIRRIVRSDCDIDPVPQPNVAIRVKHSFEQVDAYHGDKEYDEHNIAIQL